MTELARAPIPDIDDQPRRIGSVLVANRGEIARRIMRTARAEDRRCVAVFAHEDRCAPHVREADEAIELVEADPIAAYMNGTAIVDAALRSGAEAIHPGYGFLAENAEFARMVSEAGLVFIGPSPDVIALMGDKVGSRAFAEANGCPIAPSATQSGDLDDFIAAAERTVGFPLLIKASAGGGGKGMTIVRGRSEFADKARLASNEAERYFGDGRIYAERYFERPRHIEVQVIGDGAGNVIHLFERECSIQRRFQKVIEEAPAPNLPDTLRDQLTNAAVSLASAAKYKNAGTVEFIVDETGEFYFLEMNTRLQVEHPVSELITGIDLVAEQFAVAETGALRLAQPDVQATGHAIECRIAAEEPEHGFRPAVGTVRKQIEPKGPGIRLDSGLTDQLDIPPAFDPTFAKLIAFGDDRSQAIARMAQALADYVILGVPTNIAFLQRVTASDDFLNAQTTTAFVAENADLLEAPPPAEVERRAFVSVAMMCRPEFRQLAQDVPQPHAAIGHWRN